MKKIKLIFFLFVGSSFISCASPNFGPVGIVFTQGTLPVYASKTESSKKAKSCMYGVFGLIAWGGKSVPDIAKSAEITTVNNITYTSFGFLGYSSLCAIVEGD